MTDDEEVSNGVWYWCGICMQTLSINDVRIENKKRYCPKCGYEVSKVEEEE